MMCEECGKRKATFHMTEIVNGKSKKLNLCESCASGNEEFSFNASFTIQDLLAGLLDMPGDQDIEIDFIEDISCDQCNTTYEEFKRSGRFGCSNCYTAFRGKLDPLFRKIHGHDTHIGKIPNRTGAVIKVKKDINTLKNRLKSAISTEEFETAAELRDEIKKLENEIKNK